MHQCEEKEIWKDIAGFEGLYQVSNYGSVRSLDRVTTQLNNGVLCEFHYKGKVLKGKADSRGYIHIHVSKDGIGHYLSVHRLVAEAFCPKPDGCDVVNHLDANPSNNHADNLEWTTYSGNMQWASKLGHMTCKHENWKKAIPTNERPVIATDRNGNSYWFKSEADAAMELNVDRSHIPQVCRNDYGYKTVGGYSFQYA